MKKILIAGAKSYIGESIEKWLLKRPKDFKIDTIDMQGLDWKSKSFSNYDVIFYVAGIAHKKETKENTYLYYKINRDLVVDVAKKASKAGIKQFIYISSMSVYGKNIGEIKKETVPKPVSHYGRSKLQAEEILKELDSEKFKICILRPPMVYGKDCKGNFQKLRKVAISFPFFPKFYNKRSMIYIENLAKFVEKIIENNMRGIFIPQDEEYVNTSNMVYQIAKAHEKKIIETTIFNPLIKLGIKLNINILNKVFGDLVYEKVDIVKGKKFKDIINNIERE